MCRPRHLLNLDVFTMADAGFLKVGGVHLKNNRRGERPSLAKGWGTTFGVYNIKKGYILGQKGVKHQGVKTPLYQRQSIRAY